MYFTYEQITKNKHDFTHYFNNHCAGDIIFLSAENINTEAGWPDLKNRTDIFFQNIKNNTIDKETQDKAKDFDIFIESININDN